MLAGADGLTEKDNTFDERDVLRAYAQPPGRAHGRATARSGRAVRQPRRRAGHVARGLTTAELVGVERRLIAAAVGRAGEDSAASTARDLVGRWPARERQITGEQRAAVHATVATSGNGVQVIEALAGTGKTFTAGVLATSTTGAATSVIGVAPTGRAVRELTDEARLPARTLASMVLRIRNGVELPERTRGGAR